MSDLLRTFLRNRKAAIGLAIVLAFVGKEGGFGFQMEAHQGSIGLASIRYEFFSAPTLASRRL